MKVRKYSTSTFLFHRIEDSSSINSTLHHPFSSVIAFTISPFELYCRFTFYHLMRLFMFQQYKSSIYCETNFSKKTFLLTDTEISLEELTYLIFTFEELRSPVSIFFSIVNFSSSLLLYYCVHVHVIYQFCLNSVRKPSIMIGQNDFFSSSFPLLFFSI